MRVIVLGAGVIGVSTAWYLRQAGCEVTVIERQPAAALETSFANGACKVSKSLGLMGTINNYKPMPMSWH
ncbi:MAG: FAD-dependent oxidoreductase [Burkholderiales bacterium]